MPTCRHQTNSRGLPARREQAFRRVVLGLAWLVLYLIPGIVGRDPWKQDETYTFGRLCQLIETEAERRQEKASLRTRRTDFG